jgi:hypothetical protein
MIVERVDYFDKKIIGRIDAKSGKLDLTPMPSGLILATTTPIVCISDYSPRYRPTDHLACIQGYFHFQTLIPRADSCSYEQHCRLYSRFSPLYHPTGHKI